MKNAIYDNDSFFEAYAEMPRSKCGLEAAGEWRQLRPLFPDLQGKSVLDLGCGYGWHCKYAVQMGAFAVLGVDNSEKMLAMAMNINSHERIRYENCSIEDYTYPENAFDLAVSNLALHYVKDLGSVYRRVHRALKTGGCFLFNIEHPAFTAGVNEDRVYDGDKMPLYWPIDNYFYPGERKTVFLGRRVLKQHHTLTQILSPLLQNGFQLAAVEEAMPSEEMLGIPGMPDEMRRPMMLLVKAKKI